MQISNKWSYLVVEFWRDVEGLYDGELGDGGGQVDGVERGHGHQDQVEHWQHLRTRQHVQAHLFMIQKRGNLFMHVRCKAKDEWSMWHH